MFGWRRRDPAHLVEARKRMAEAIYDYPVYEPPHRQSPHVSRQLRSHGEEKYLSLVREFAARGRENLDYFMNHRNVRLDALRTFLAKYDVVVDLDDAGVDAVSAWCPGRCGALVANLRQNKTQQVFYQLLESWTDQWRGLNVIFDLGIFLGESVIMRNRRLNWIYQGGASEDGTAYGSGFGIRGFRNKRDWLDPMQHMYHKCLRDEDDIRSDQIGHRMQATYFAGAVRDYSTR